MNPIAAARDLASDGALRFAVMYSNPVLAAGTPATGDLRGIAVDMGQALGRYVNLPTQIIGFATRKELLAGQWDVAVAAYDAHRPGFSCSAPFLETHGTYLVPPGSSIKAVEEVDRPDVVISVSAESALELHLARTIRQARLAPIPGAPAAADLFMAGNADVLAGMRQQLLRVAAQFPGSRILDGHFMAIRHALSMRSERKAGFERLCEFVEHAKASGLVAQLIANNGILGVSVSAAA